LKFIPDDANRQWQLPPTQISPPVQPSNPQKYKFLVVSGLNPRCKV
jgi:hypothetical protein